MPSRSGAAPQAASSSSMLVTGRAARSFGDLEPSTESSHRRSEEPLIRRSAILRRTNSFSVPDNLQMMSLPQIRRASQHHQQKRRKSNAEHVEVHDGISRAVTLPNVKSVSWGDAPSLRRELLHVTGSQLPDVAGATEKQAPDAGRFLPLFREVQKTVNEEVEHNWVLQEENSKNKRKLRALESHISISVPDEDPMVTIQRRIEEVRMMTRNKNRGEDGILAWLPPERREYVMKIKDIPIAQFKKSRRKGWKLSNYIRWVARMMKILIPVFIRSKLYFFEIDSKKQTEKEEAALMSKFVRIRCSMGSELHFAMITAPRCRSPFMIKKIRWLLKATKAFTHLFPAEMETEVARHVGYEAYDDGRVIAHQGRKPDRFYYVITGRVSIMQQYQLSTGKVTKSFGLLSKGMTSDSEEMEKQWVRTNSLVAKGKVEVLVIDKKDFAFLQKTNQGPPVEFLKSITLFGEFPLEKFNEFPEATEYKYYAQGKVIVQDSNRTPFIHVVKSGHVKVMRYQTVYDAGLCNSRTFNSRTKEEVGCGKAFSHAGAMLGRSFEQRKVKRHKTDLALPRIKTCINGFQAAPNPFSKTMGVEISLPTGVGGDRSSTPLIYKSKTTSFKSSSERSFHDDIRTQAVITITGPDDLTPPTSPLGSEQFEMQKSQMLSSAVSRSLPSGARITEDNEGDFEPHGLWMTREKTGTTNKTTKHKHQRHKSFDSSQKNNAVTSDMNFYRKAYLQLDLLNPGDIFGLDHMRSTLASEGRGVSLLSDGAEVVRINKRFFIQHAGNNTMLKLDTLHREYISKEDAKKALYEKETWAQYKTAMWNKMIEKLPKITTY